MKAPYSLAVLAAIAVLVAGCASDGGLKPQSTVASANDLATRATLAEASVSPAAWPASEWWKRYGDAQLDALVDEALKGSPTLRIAEARVRQAVAIEGLANANLSPQVGANARSTRQLYSENSNVPKPLAGSWQWANEATLNFSYELDFWGKNEAGLQAAIGRKNAANIDQHATRLVLIVGITQTYLRLSQAHAQLELAQQVLKQREHVLELTRQRVKAQIDSSVDLKQAEFALPVAREQIAAAKESISLLQTQLAALTGAGPDRGLTITRPQLQAIKPAGLPSTLPSELLARRPDVIAQRWRVEAQLQDIKVAKAQFYPSFNIAGLIGLQSLGFGKFLQGGSQISSLGGGLSLPIFDGGRLRSNLALRDAEYDIAVEQYNLTLVDALRDVVSQLTSIQWLQERAAQQAEALRTSQEAYDLAVRRYQSGVGNYLQVLASESQVLSQQRAQIDFDARAFDLDMNLVRALGGGY
jgi:NodT family efflux transporter outer membrane factor (OMF) lipoprotein